MLSATIKSTSIEVRSGVGKNGPWERKTQIVGIDLGSGFFEPVQIERPNGQPLPVGEYDFVPRFRRGKYGDLEVDMRSSELVAKRAAKAS